MILAGAVADIIGSRVINLFGTFVLGIFILASGLASTGIQLIIFRVLQGIGVAMCFPTAVSILSAAFLSGRVRNISFACLGLGTPFGFTLGLLLGGVYESSTIGWRLGFYLCAGLAITLLALNFWYLPYENRGKVITWSKLANEIDWIGILILSTSLGLMACVLALVPATLFYL